MVRNPKNARDATKPHLGITGILAVHIRSIGGLTDLILCWHQLLQIIIFLKTCSLHSCQTYRFLLRTFGRSQRPSVVSSPCSPRLVTRRQVEKSLCLSMDLFVGPTLNVYRAKSIVMARQIQTSQPRNQEQKSGIKHFIKVRLQLLFGSRCSGSHNNANPSGVPL